ncbi:TPA: hypothetical protein DDZ86_00730 [Candidatus Dependentiae bacterium]|nr:MAG: hypothetical protein UW09_C0004G0029 [candidate division TM6 bacterium GW2011_GWF2_43_87]HBL98149.1 hypothetical protein [Candidatus Dependentiae bacterium]
MYTYRFFALLLLIIPTVLTFSTTARGEFSDTMSWDDVADLMLQKTDYKKLLQNCEKEDLYSLRWVFEQELARAPKSTQYPSQFKRVNKELFVDRDHVPFLAYLGTAMGSAITAGVCAAYTAIMGYRATRIYTNNIFNKTALDYSNCTFKAPLKWAGISAGCFLSLLIMAKIDTALERRRHQNAHSALKENLQNMITYINQMVNQQDYLLFQSSEKCKNLKIDYTNSSFCNKPMIIIPSTGNFILHAIGLEF